MERTDAAAAYLTRIREEYKKSRGLTFKYLAKKLKTSDSQIQRILSGDQDTRGAMWFQLAEAIGASKVYLALLLARPTADKDEGIKVANWWLSLSPEQQQMYEALLSTSDGRERLLRAAIDLLDSLKPPE